MSPCCLKIQIHESLHSKDSRFTPGFTPIRLPDCTHYLVTQRALGCGLGMRQALRWGTHTCSARLLQGLLLYSCG